MTAMTRHYKKPVLLIEFDENKPFSLQVSYAWVGVLSDDAYGGRGFPHPRKFKLLYTWAMLFLVLYVQLLYTWAMLFLVLYVQLLYTWAMLFLVLYVQLLYTWAMLFLVLYVQFDSTVS